MLHTQLLLMLQADPWGQASLSLGSQLYPYLRGQCRVLSKLLDADKGRRLQASRKKSNSAAVVHGLVAPSLPTHSNRKYEHPNTNQFGASRAQTLPPPKYTSVRSSDCPARTRTQHEHVLNTNTYWHNTTMNQSHGQDVKIVRQKPMSRIPPRLCSGMVYCASIPCGSILLVPVLSLPCPCYRAALSSPFSAASCMGCHLSANLSMLTSHAEARDSVTLSGSISARTLTAPHSQA
jgi:hypothetical protein